MDRRSGSAALIALGQVEILHGDAGEHIVALDLVGQELDVHVVDGEPQSPVGGRCVWSAAVAAAPTPVAVRFCRTRLPPQRPGWHARADAHPTPPTPFATHPGSLRPAPNPEPVRCRTHNAETRSTTS